MEQIVRSNQSVILMGPTGNGKTLTMRNYMNNCVNTETDGYKYISFNSNSEADKMKSMIEQKLSKKR